jgi:hypothetical protein
MSGRSSGCRVDVCQCHVHSSMLSLWITVVDVPPPYRERTSTATCSRGGTSQNRDGASGRYPAGTLPPPGPPRQHGNRDITGFGDFTPIEVPA